MNIENIGLGGLLHDIGKRELPYNSKYITANNMSLSDNIKQYKEHSRTGYNILKQIIPDQQKVLDIILQHHEHCDGTGFPQEFKRMQIYYPARIIRIIDDFCNLIFPPLHQVPVSCEEAINIMRNNKMQKYDKEIFNVFLKTFK
jgi:HD-GYP domain-containing protein (c-di-GMP phosphodiesterase class II)